MVDPNVIISAVLSPAGSPPAVLREWMTGGFELVVSPLLLAELERALAYPKIRQRLPAPEARELVHWLRGAARLVPDQEGPPPVHSADPGDDYLIALAASERAVLVSGDRHLLQMAGELPVESPAVFLRRL